MIDDPALMISFVSLLAAVTTVAISSHPAELIDTFGSSRAGRAITSHTGISPTDLHRRLTSDASAQWSARLGRH